MIVILLIYRSHSKKQNSSIDVSWELVEHTEFMGFFKLAVVSWGRKLHLRMINSLLLEWRQHHGSIWCSVSLFQCTYNKTSITQQSFLFVVLPLCLCFLQDAREFHISVHLGVNGLEQQRKQNWWNSRGGTHDASPLAMANDPAAPEKPPAAGEAERMTPES